MEHKDGSYIVYKGNSPISLYLIGLADCSFSIFLTASLHCDESQYTYVMNTVSCLCSSSQSIKLCSS